MKLYIGCYTKKIADNLVGEGNGIYILDFDASNGSFKLLDCEEVVNPSYLTLSSSGDFLFAIEENPIKELPKIRSYQIVSPSNGKYLQLLSEQDLKASYACHLAVTKSDDHLIVGGYMSGNVLVFPVSSDGKIKPSIHQINHVGNGPNKLRQESAHVHFICPTNDEFFYAVDLGLDKVKAYKFDQDTIQEQKENSFDTNPGSGPRHMCLSKSGDFIFIFSELDAEIQLYKKESNKIQLLGSVKTLPEEFKGEPSGGTIKIHPNGKFIYVSNRVYNGITAFSFDETNQKIILVGFTSSGGNTPRDMDIDPKGNWLICANQDSHNLVAFKIDQKSGELLKTDTIEKVKSPSCVKFGN